MQNILDPAAFPTLAYLYSTPMWREGRGQCKRKVKKREKISFEREKLFPCLRSEVQPVGLCG